MKRKLLKAPKGYRIHLTGGGNAVYFLTIKFGQKLVPAPTQLRGTFETCRAEAVAMCEAHVKSPHFYDFDT